MKSSQLRVTHVVGARPNIPKITPVVREFEKYHYVSQRIIDTGQHHDFNLAAGMRKALGLRDPDLTLSSASAHQGQMTAKALAGIESDLLANRPDVLICYGDVNSTLAAALAAVKLGVPIAHVEAGLRSGDRSMPEEINRILVDQMSDFLFAPDAKAILNLERELIPKSKLFLVGNVMSDSIRLTSQERRKLQRSIQRDRGDKFGFVTLHRPSNVDSEKQLRLLLEALNEVSKNLPLVFSVHPRTQQVLEKFRISVAPEISLVPPMNYLSATAMIAQAALCITDSGGVQEEALLLGTQCLTLRESTERPITVDYGFNRLTRPENLSKDVSRVLEMESDELPRPPFWDGYAAQRITEILLATLGKSRP